MLGERLSEKYDFENCFFLCVNFAVKVGSVLSDKKLVISGVPQGSVLGPLLFTLYTSDLLARLQCPFAAYADDVKIFSSSNECRHINKP
jgi:hypothetical protein